MFEQDYVLRLIKELTRTLLMLLFHIELDSPSSQILEEKEAQQILDTLLDFIDNGDIDKAENMVYELTFDADMTKLEIALLFYAYLNDKPDSFLQENNFSREEVLSGVKDLVSRYGLEGVSEVFLE